MSGAGKTEEDRGIHLIGAHIARLIYRFLVCCLSASGSARSETPLIWLLAQPRYAFLMWLHCYLNNTHSWSGLVLSFTYCGICLLRQPLRNEKWSMKADSI